MHAAISHHVFADSDDERICVFACAQSECLSLRDTHTWLFVCVCSDFSTGFIKPIYLFTHSHKQRVKRAPKVLQLIYGLFICRCGLARRCASVLAALFHTWCVSHMPKLSSAASSPASASATWVIALATMPRLFSGAMPLVWGHNIFFFLLFRLHGKNRCRHNFRPNIQKWRHYECVRQFVCVIAHFHQFRADVVAALLQ